MAVNNSNAFDFDRFEINTAPEKKPQRNDESLKRVAPLTDREIKRQQKAAFYKSLKMFCFVSLMCASVMLQVTAAAKNFALERDIHAVEYEISVAQSENIRLRAELNSITGIAFIDNYATEILGMTKVESYQVECVDLSGSDTVLYSSGVFGK